MKTGLTYFIHKFDAIRVNPPYGSLQQINTMFGNKEIKSEYSLLYTKFKWATKELHSSLIFKMT